MRKVFRFLREGTLRNRLLALLMMRLARMSQLKENGGSRSRSHWRFKAGNAEVTLLLASSDSLSREEMYSMLSLIRKNEVRMGWKTPEPDMDPPTLSTEVLELQIMGMMVCLGNARLNTLAQFAESLGEREV